MNDRAERLFYRIIRVFYQDDEIIEMDVEYWYPDRLCVENSMKRHQLYGVVYEIKQRKAVMIPISPEREAECRDEMALIVLATLGME